MTLDVTTVKLATPLPCGTLAATGRACGRDAWAAYAYTAEATGIERRFPGHWVLLPVCERCATDTAEHYDD